MENVFPNFNSPSTLQLLTLISRNPSCSGDTTIGTFFQSGNGNFRERIRYTGNHIVIYKRLVS